MSKVARHRNHAEEGLRQRVTELEHDLARAHAEAASWKRQLARRQPVDGEWAAERRAMEAEQLALRTSLSTLEAELSQLDVVQLQCELRAVRAREASTRQQLKRREEEARVQRGAVEEARSGAAGLRGRLEALEAYVRRLEGVVEKGAGVDVGGLHAGMKQQLELERGLYKQVGFHIVVVYVPKCVLAQSLQSMHQEQLACKDAAIIRLEAELECVQEEAEQARTQAARLQAQIELANDRLL